MKPCIKCGRMMFVGVSHELTCDDDGHWYVIPSAKRAEFERWVAAQDPNPPTWADPVDGSPCRVSFDSYYIGD